MTDGKGHFEVQHYTLFDGWINCWTTYEEESDTYFPTTYETFEEALADLDDMFDEMDYEITAGIRDFDTGYSDSEYRIARIVDGAVTDIYPYKWLKKPEVNEARIIATNIYANNGGN